MSLRRAIAFLLGLVGVLHSPAHAAESWTVARFAEVGGQSLAWSRESGSQSSYLAVEFAAESTAVLRSSDSGGSWLKLGRAAPVDAAHFTALHSLARTRASWGDLLVTTNGSQAYRRQPSRSDWEIFGPKGEGPISAVASLPNDGLLVARESADPDQRLYRSTDDGANWNAIPLSHLIGQVDLLRAFDPGPIFVLDDVGQIWRADSTNFAPAAPFLARLLDLRTAATLYALAFDHTIQRSTDGGTNWERLSSDLASTEGWREELDRAFSFGVDGTFAWLAAPSAIWTSHDGAATWALALHADSLYSAAAWNADAHELVLGGREVIQTRDEGELFLARSGLDFARTALFDDGAAAALSGGLLMSGDGGATWERWSWDGEADQLASLRAFGRFGFVTRIADTGPSLFVSTNRGRAWSASLDAPRDLREVKRTDDGVWWGAAGGGIYRASDAAPQFKAVSSPLATVDHVAFVDARLGLANRARELALTSDAGASWTLVAAPEDSLTDLLWVNSDTLFAAGLELYRSSDRGAHWEAIPGTSAGPGRWRALARADRFTHWASGDHGSLAVARDGWTFQMDDTALEPRDPSADLLTLSFAGAERGLSGWGARLWRYAADQRGPRFTLHGVFHPLLPHVLHLYFTCGERLRGDSLRVAIGSERFTLRAGADPFLYPLTYPVPRGVGAVNLAVTGTDLAGNRATTNLAFATTRGTLGYRDGDFELRFAGAIEGSALVAFALDPDQLPPLPSQFVSAARPLRCAEERTAGRARSKWRLQGAVRVHGATPHRTDFAVLGPEGWSRWTEAAFDEADPALTLWPIEPLEGPHCVELFPNPVNSVLSLALPAEANGVWRLRIVDVAGRVRASHDARVTDGTTRWEIPKLPRGCYWLEARSLAAPEWTARASFSLLRSSP